MIRALLASARGGKGPALMPIFGQPAWVSDARDGGTRAPLVRGVLFFLLSFVALGIFSLNNNCARVYGCAVLGLSCADLQRGLGLVCHCCNVQVCVGHVLGMLHAHYF